MKVKFKKILFALFRYIRNLIIFFIALSVLLVLLYRFVPVPFTPLMVIRLAEQVKEGRPLKLKKDWEPLGNISQNMIQAVVAAEDQNFRKHWGFDLDAIQKATENNMKKKKKSIKGASTISQQTAKNVFLWPGRSWFRKGLEAWFTILIEVIWNKARIMEVYLNVIETGHGVYGAEAAAREFFNKPAKELSAYESASVAAVLPNPRKWSPVKPTSYISFRQAWIMKNMWQIGKVDLAEKNKESKSK